MRTMDTTFYFTPGDLLTGFLFICGAIITVSGALTAIIGWLSKKRAPEKIQNDRITALETRMAEFEREHTTRFEKDELRLVRLEESTEATNEALLALLGHAINDNDVEEVRNARKKLENLLIKQSRNL